MKPVSILVVILAVTIIFTIVIFWIVRKNKKNNLTNETEKNQQNDGKDYQTEINKIFPGCIYLDIKHDHKLEEIYQSIDANQSIFIEGPGGTGKTIKLQNLIYHYKHFGRENQKNIVPLASTGIASLALHGSTIHKFIGYGKNTNSLPKILNHEYWDRIADRLNDPDIVIIDEISMVNSEIIDLLDQIFRKATKNDKPFGGKIVVFCGDFLQLPPVTTDSKDSDEIWAFNSKIWKEMKPKRIELTENYRQKSGTDDDKKFIKALNDIRVGNTKTNEVRWFLQKIKACDLSEKPDDVIVLANDNKTVNEENARKLKKIPGNSKKYESEIILKKENVEGEYAKKQLKHDKEYELFRSTLELKNNCNVMTIANDRNNRFYNGSRGTVISLGEDFIEVKFDGGNIYKIERYEWNIENANSEVLATLRQFPIRLAYAVTIHKSQGMSLDSAYIVIDGIKWDGQMYVALSRVKDVNKIYANHKIREDRIKTSTAVLNFLENQQMVDIERSDSFIEAELN